MPRGPTVGTHDDEDERFEALRSKPFLVVVAVLVGILAVGAGVTASGGGTLPFMSTELEVELQPHTIQTADLQQNGTTVIVSVVDEHGEPVDGGAVTISAADARLSDRQTVSVGGGTAAWLAAGGEPSQLADNEAAFWFTSSGDGPTVRLDADTNKGSLSVDLEPPADGNYADEQSNTEILVIAG